MIEIRLADDNTEESARLLHAIYNNAHNLGRSTGRLLQKSYNFSYKSQL